MKLKGVVSTKLACILVLELCALIPKINSQIPGCPIEGINLLQCLNQGNKSSIEICCKPLTQVVQAGYSCLCSVLASSNIPLLNAPILLPFSNCFISVPPLTLCRVLAPMPIVLPPAGPKDRTQPSFPPKNVLLPPPPHEMHLPLNPRTVDNTSTLPRQPHSTESSAPKSSVFKAGNESSSGENENKILMLKCLFLCLALHVCILFA
ncbi:hypothetical protein Pint_24785 [Pistacia integerrima]|uniref:Uncharacterized protein n=1 Tax=Pistacia integerrima TaxID=434235 RepID=A0ACC0YDA0_9ROSI|nr:hypothetical protein Pint_24785 [Pistacia integerrima]